MYYIAFKPQAETTPKRRCGEGVPMEVSPSMQRLICTGQGGTHGLTDPDPRAGEGIYASLLHQQFDIYRLWITHLL
jgi:hypothetical protein